MVNDLAGMTRATMRCATWRGCWNRRCDSWLAARGRRRICRGAARLRLARGQAVAEQLRQAVQAWAPSYQGSSFTLSMSIGLVALDASMQDVASVLYAADMACYDAKRAGANRVQTGRAREASASGRVALGPA